MFFLLSNQVEFIPEIFAFLETNLTASLFEDKMWNIIYAKIELFF